MNIDSRIPGCGLHIADVCSKLKINIIKWEMRAGGRVAWLGQLARVWHHPAPVWSSSLWCKQCKSTPQNWKILFHGVHHENHFLLPWCTPWNSKNPIHGVHHEMPKSSSIMYTMKTIFSFHGVHHELLKFSSMVYTTKMPKSSSMVYTMKTIFRFHGVHHENHF